MSGIFRSSRNAVGVGRALLEGKRGSYPDVEADPEYTFRRSEKLGDYRTVLGVPMLREGVPIGVLTSDALGSRGRSPKSRSSWLRPSPTRRRSRSRTCACSTNVQARTRELAASLEDLRTAQDRLVQTEKMASLGQLTAGIAHEIKNPLNFVNNFAAVSIELLDELKDTLQGLPVDDKTRAEIDELTEMLSGNLERSPSTASAPTASSRPCWCTRARARASTGRSISTR